MHTLILWFDADSQAEATENMKRDLIMAGYTIHTVQHRKDAEDYIGQHRIHMLIVHVSGTGDHAVNILRSDLKQWLQDGNMFPVILLFDSEDTEAVVNSFEAGANDVMILPVNSREMVARIQNLLNLFEFAKLSHSEPVIAEDLTIEPESRTVTRGDKPIHLTVKEFDLLLYLAKHKNQVCSRDDILKKVWNYDFHLGTNVVDVYIRHLRKKIDQGYGKKLIHSVHGVGYILKEG